jgi:hypothetical protein
MAKVLPEHEPEATPAEHTAELTVWDVPPTTVAGERFAVSVGVRCSGGCNLGGRALNIFDQEGSPAGTVTLGHDVWPGTEALYFAQIEATAPFAVGSHQWDAKFSGWEAELPHAGGSVPVMIRVVPAPQCVVTVEAVDRETQAPIAGARVVMHPYRAVTDDNGIARLPVAKDQYDVLVSMSRYVQACASIEVTADATTRVELDTDRPWESPDEESE